MAETSVGRRLTEVHRRLQLRLRAATLAEVLAVWPAFSLDDIDGSWPAVETSLIALITARRRQSAETTARYYQALRAAEGAQGASAPVLAPDPSRLTLVATLRLLGPIQAKKNIAAGVPDPGARTFTRLSGSVSRHVLNGGRATLTESVKADPEASGYRRITSGSPCDFCADLASKGIVGASVDFPAHDHCSCTQEPAWKRLKPPPPDAARKFISDLFAEADRISASGDYQVTTEQTAGGFYFPPS